MKKVIPTRLFPPFSDRVACPSFQARKRSYGCASRVYAVTKKCVCLSQTIRHACTW